MWTSGMSYKFLPFWIKDLKGVQNIEKEVFFPLQSCIPQKKLIPLSLKFSIQEIPITSFICDVNNGAPISEYDDEIEIKGIAYSGGGRSVISLGVTPDGGKTWIPGVLEEGKDQIPGQAWAWTFWSCTVPITKGLFFVFCFLFFVFFFFSSGLNPTRNRAKGKRETGTGI